MRGAFIRALTELAAHDPRVLLLTGDLGYTVIEPFAERFPTRFFNVGVAEQNMIGLATGLAEAGFTPFTYSIATFATLRPYEFIRNGPVLQQLPVRIVGVGGGLEYGSAGPTHHAVEDVGLMRLQAGLTVVCPADHRQAVTALSVTRDLAGPVYYRLGKDDRTTVPGLEGRFELARVEQVRGGSDLAIVAMGSVASEAAIAAERLAELGIQSALLVVAGLYPSPADHLAELLAPFPIALTVEAHSTIGGVGSLVAEVIAERRLNCRLVRRGISTILDGVSGGEPYLLDEHGLSSDALVATVLRTLGRTAS
jgi:transketolase